MIYEVEFSYEGEWRFHHQVTARETAERDAEEYGRLLNVPCRARVRTPEEEAAIAARA